MMKVERQKLLKSKKNVFIHRIYDKLDSLRTLAYSRGDDDWFHHINELCIWTGNQLEFKTWYEDIDDNDIGEAIITP